MEVERTEVEKLAYHLWQERGRPIGSPDEDWFRAEAKLRQQNSKYELPLFALAMEAREDSWR